MTSATAPEPRTLELTDAEFRQVARLARDLAGLDLSPAKRALISSRLAKRLRATGQSDFASYLSEVERGASPEERSALISALTTNVSHFFRENHHFDLLRRDLLPDMLARARAGQRVRIWSAGCSTGQEPYSIAMTLLDAEPEVGALDVRILATDIDEQVLATAKAGRYEERLLDGIEPGMRARYLRRLSEGSEALFEVQPALRKLVTFRTLNLVAPWPLRGPFDVIFCRNVVIYFSGETQDALWPRFANLLRPGGMLFLGHSERVSPGIVPSLASAGVTAYRKSAH